MHYPKITIITIVLNGEKHLERCLKSIVSQNYPNLEYIVIDGESIDGTLQIIEKYRSFISKIISEKDKGISDAFNKGIRLATGEIIGIINADDWLEKDILIRLVEPFKYNNEIVYGKINQWYSNSVLVAHANHKLLNKRMTLNHPAVFAKRNVYHKFGYFNLDFRIAMDYEWLLRCYINHVKFEYLDVVMVNMDMSGLSMQNWRKGLLEVQKAKNMHLDKPIQTKLYYWYQVFSTYFSVLFINSPFKTVFHFYQKFASPVKKESIKNKKNQI